MIIKVSEDKELVTLARKMLKENGGYCPCAIVKEPEFKCMCDEFLKNTDKGPCYCGLYEKVES